MIRREYDGLDQIWCQNFIESLSFYETGPVNDPCLIWIRNSKSRTRYNPFRAKYPERYEPESLSVWAIAFIAENGYVENGFDVNFNNLIQLIKRVVGASNCFCRL